MIKSFATAALTFGLLVAAPAMAAETLVHNGTTYEYTVAQKGPTRLITGRDMTNGRAFTLRVAHGRVEGVVDGNAVSFPLRDVKSTVAKTEVAAR